MCSLSLVNVVFLYNAYIALLPFSNGVPITNRANLHTSSISTNNNTDTYLDEVLKTFLKQNNLSYIDNAQKAFGGDFDQIQIPQHVLQLKSAPKPDNGGIISDFSHEVQKSLTLSQNEGVPPPTEFSNEFFQPNSEAFSNFDNAHEDLDHLQEQLSKVSEHLNLSGDEETPLQNFLVPAMDIDLHEYDNDLLSRKPSRDTPQYMLDLFEKFENDPMMEPTSNIVRSFFNQATEKDKKAYHDNYLVCTERLSADICPRIHHLIFDVTSIPDHERVTMAELRLYKIVERDRRKYIGLDRKVEIAELKRTLLSNGTTANLRRNVLDSRRIIGRTSGWETFFITQAIRRWVKDKKTPIHELEIYIENISTGSDENVIEFEQNSKTINEPLLILFSDDVSKHHRLERQEELEELLNHARKKPKTTSGSNRHQMQNILSRRRRSVNQPCHLEPMYVNFADIGYDSWIAGPAGYSAGHCVGTCSFPYNNIGVSPHAAIQTFMHRQSPTHYKRPCCVPTKLGPIPLLYFEKHALAYKHRYEGMKVLKCGCR
ncbi:bone morphogenetic protein 10-like [Clavelina lepadiformis]|uniref:bone morphogenetic protein 10-like n=1 Tax=Clavelina lepadiformis TaxID=159417 RepID=UPI0040411373